MLNEASKSFHLSMLFAIIAAHLVMLLAWYAAHGRYGLAIALAVPSSILWRNCFSEGRRSARLHIAANLDAADPLSQNQHEH